MDSPPIFEDLTREAESLEVEPTTEKIPPTQDISRQEESQDTDGYKSLLPPLPKESEENVPSNTSFLLHQIPQEERCRNWTTRIYSQGVKRHGSSRQYENCHGDSG